MAGDAVSSSREAYEAHPLPDAATGWTDELGTALVVASMSRCVPATAFTNSPAIRNAYCGLGSALRRGRCHCRTGRRSASVTPSAYCIVERASASIPAAGSRFRLGEPDQATDAALASRTGGIC